MMPSIFLDCHPGCCEWCILRESVEQISCLWRYSYEGFFWHIINCKRIQSISILVIIQLFFIKLTVIFMCNFFLKFISVQYNHVDLLYFTIKRLVLRTARIVFKTYWHILAYSILSKSFIFP